jgi:hypothetical protein
VFGDLLLAVEAATARCDIPAGWKVEPVLHDVRHVG